MKKSTVILGSLAIVCLSLGFAFGANGTNASAETVDGGLSGFETEAKASIRIDGENSGIRFTTNVSSATVESLESAYEKVEFYTLFAKATEVESVAEVVYGGENVYAVKATQQPDGVNYAQYKLVLTGIPQAGYGVQWNARGVALCTDEAGKITPVYATADTDGARSVYQVALSAVEYGVEDTDGGLSKYFNAVENTDGLTESVQTGDTIVLNIPALQDGESVKAVYYQGKKVEATVEENTVSFAKEAIENFAVDTEYAFTLFTDAYNAYSASYIRLVPLATPTVSYQKSGMGYEVTWSAVENASSYNYRKIVNGEEGEWVNTEETCAMVFYGDYPTGTVSVCVEVVACATDGRTGEAGVSEAMSISDPTFTYKPRSLVVYEADYFVPTPVKATTEDKYGMKGLQFDPANNTTLTWTAYLYGAETVATQGDREWEPSDGEFATGLPVGNGDTVLGYSSWVGYVNGVMTEKTLGSFDGIYVYAPFGVRITYTITNDFGRTATYTHSVVANNKGTEVNGVYGEENMGVINGGIQAVSATDSQFSYGLEGGFKMSNDGKQTYLEFLWTPNIQISSYSVISFFVYNPNDFDLSVAWVGTAYKGFYTVKAQTILEFNIYLPDGASVYGTHGIMDGENNTTPWTIDVRKLSDPANPGSMLADAYDFYVGGLRFY